MADIQGVPAELLVRLFYKNTALGAAGVVPVGGAGDGNVYLFTGGSAMTSQYDAQFTNVAAIASACFNRQASQSVSGAKATIGDCNLTGAKEFAGQFVNGFTNSYNALGNVLTLDIASPNSAANCLKWGQVTAAGQRWTMIELAGWRDSNDGEVVVAANIARAITAADPSAGPRFGGVNPGDNNFSATLTLDPNSGWGTGPGGLFPLFEQDGTTAASTPVSLGFEMGTPAIYEDLITLCSSDSALRGVPLTAALVAANVELQTALIQGV